MHHTDQWKNRWIRQGEQQPLLLIDRYTWGEMAPLQSYKWPKRTAFPWNDFTPIFLEFKKHPTYIFHCVFWSRLCIVIKGKSLKMTTDFYCLIMGGISRPLEAITIRTLLDRNPCSILGIGVVVVAVVAWHSPKRRNCCNKNPFPGDQKVVWFVITSLFFFWNEKGKKAKSFSYLPHSKTFQNYIFTKKNSTALKRIWKMVGCGGWMSWFHLPPSFLQHRVLEASATSACTRCISTMSRTKPGERESEKDVVVLWVHPGSPTGHHFLWVGDYEFHYVLWRKGLSSCKRNHHFYKTVVDFQGVHGGSFTVYTCRLLKANRNPATGTQANVSLVQVIVPFHHQVNHKQIYLKIMLWEDVCWMSYPWNALPPFTKSGASFWMMINYKYFLKLHSPWKSFRPPIFIIGRWRQVSRIVWESKSWSSSKREVHQSFWQNGVLQEKNTIFRAPHKRTESVPRDLHEVPKWEVASQMAFHTPPVHAALFPGGGGTTKNWLCLVIQAVTFRSPNVGGHQQPP